MVTAAGPRSRSGRGRGGGRVSLLGGLFRRWPTAPGPPPTRPFFHAVQRPDVPPNPGMTDAEPERLEKPPQRPAAGDPPAGIGDHIGPQDFLHERPEDVFPPPWPLWLYEIGDLEDLPWSEPGRRKPYPVASDATIIRELPAWRYFGPHGDGVPEILEQVWTLDRVRIASLGFPPADHKPGRIPIATLVVPENARGPENARFEVARWMESRSWVSGSGGGWYYSGCHCTYSVSDPRWLSAMGLARNAAVALAARDHFDPATVDAALRAWQDLAG